MKSLYLFLFFTLIVVSSFFSVYSFTEATTVRCDFTSYLKVGSRGESVKCVQERLGVQADGIFGPITKAAVVSFQSNNGLFVDGIVGPKSYAMLNGDLAQAVYPEGCTSASGYSFTTGARCDGSVSTTVENNSQQNIASPKVFSVSPGKVRAGDQVTIYGENFTPTGNTVRLGYGQIEATFEDLSSPDGQTISFIYQPPDVKVMTKEELLDLPPQILDKILGPVEAVGGSIDDIVAPYRNLKTENDLRQFLSKNGHSFEDLYDKFYVTIENSYGHSISSSPILLGLRKFKLGSDSWDQTSGLHSKLVSAFTALSSFFVPKKTHAQSPEGGYNSGMIMECTCEEGYLTFIIDYSSNGGTGLYWWYDGFPVIVGDPQMSGPHLGFFTQNAGVCVVGATPYCAEIDANMASLPWGEAPY